MSRFRRRSGVIARSIHGSPPHRAVDAKAAELAGVGSSCRIVATPGANAVAKASAVPTDASAPSARVLAFHGDLDVSDKARIEHALGEIERYAPGTIAILDLTDVQYLDTTFLNALLRGANRPRVVAPPGSMPSRIFAITKLDAQFEVFADLASAQTPAANYVGPLST